MNLSTPLNVIKLISNNESRNRFGPAPDIQPKILLLSDVLDNKCPKVNKKAEQNISRATGLSAIPSWPAVPCEIPDTYSREVNLPHSLWGVKKTSADTGNTVNNWGKSKKCKNESYQRCIHCQHQKPLCLCSTTLHIYNILACRSLLIEGWTGIEKILRETFKLLIRGGRKAVIYEKPLTSIQNCLSFLKGMLSCCTCRVEGNSYCMTCELNIQKAAKKATVCAWAKDHEDEMLYIVIPYLEVLSASDHATLWHALNSKCCSTRILCSYENPNLYDCVLFPWLPPVCMIPLYSPDLECGKTGNNYMGNIRRMRFQSSVTPDEVKEAMELFPRKSFFSNILTLNKEESATDDSQLESDGLSSPTKEDDRGLLTILECLDADQRQIALTIAERQSEQEVGRRKAKTRPMVLFDDLKELMKQGHGMTITVLERKLKELISHGVVEENIRPRAYFTKYTEEQVDDAITKIEGKE